MRLPRVGRVLPHADFKRNVFLRFAMSSLVDVWLRRVLLRRWGATLADTAYLSPGSYFNGSDFAIGDGCFLNHGCYIDTYAPVRLGRNVWIGQRTTILTATHDLGDASQRAGTPHGKPVVIEDGCWIGASVTVCPGCIIGPGCVIAAGAVVAHDCDANGLYGGVPAQRLRDLQ